MTYQQALEWIHSHRKFASKPGLKRMLWALEELDNPQDKLLAVHVVGTNGKGSTVNNVQHIFTAAGYEVGTFVSPYIMDFKERISLNGQMISERDFLRLIEVLKPLTDRVLLETSLGPFTEFEVITLMMFLYFGHLHPVDIAIIEAGLGGLYDSTNVFKADLVICPSIGLDHQAILGQTYGEIAKQKAGVIKEGQKVLIAIDNEEAKQVFREQSAQMSASLYDNQKDFQMLNQGESYQFQSPLGDINAIQLAMPGQHQVTNAALAIMASLLLKETFPQINERAIKEGLKTSYWLGRTELLRTNLMIDGSHNKESLLALIAVLKKDYADKKIHILFAAIEGKPIEVMLKLLDRLGHLQVTGFEYPTAYPLKNYNQSYKKVSDFKEWLKGINYDSKEDFYLVTGSLYFIAQVRQYWFLSQAASKQ
ncbi:bifunctional folylpolyglutamate synthase/dihydrofolate synthase [Streptococcus didelphis]|uniref:bifunctional folylpolyglutamate synthase/dihydrofolate synthase n=1 Tax=Streptococcus didelphis TaxID=102886 RepID=UPI00035F8E78|nr:folylpolyglutamate synthase/dihydrofolate synthase family protein [Streptococcus didelphis]